MRQLRKHEKLMKILVFVAMLALLGGSIAPNLLLLR